MTNYDIQVLEFYFRRHHENNPSVREPNGHLVTIYKKILIRFIRAFNFFNFNLPAAITFTVTAGLIAIL